MAHGCAEIGRTDEHAVDALDSGDRVEVGPSRFSTWTSRHICSSAWSGIPASRCSSAKPRPAALPPTRARPPAMDSARRAHQPSAWGGAIDHQYQQGSVRVIEQLLDQRGVACTGAGRLAGVRAPAPQLAEQATQIVGRVLAVQQQPVEAGVGSQLTYSRNQPGRATGRSAPRRCAGRSPDWRAGPMPTSRRNGGRCCQADRSRHGRCPQRGRRRRAGIAKAAEDHLAGLRRTP